MPNETPFFQAFGPLLFGRPARAALTRLGKLDSLQELYAIFGDLFPQRLLSPTEKGLIAGEEVCPHGLRPRHRPRIGDGVRPDRHLLMSG